MSSPHTVLAMLYAEDRERPREALGGGALTTWHPHPTPGSGPQGVGIHHPAQCPGWGRRSAAPGVPPSPGASVPPTLHAREKVPTSPRVASPPGYGRPLYLTMVAAPQGETTLSVYLAYYLQQRS